MKKGWFGPRRFGLGVSPTSWQGWVVTVVIVAGIGVSIRLLAPAIHERTGWPLPVATVAISMTGLALLLVIIALTYRGSGPNTR